MGSPGRLVYGQRPAAEALRARPAEIQAAFLAEGGRRDPALERQLAALGLVPVHRPGAALHRLTGGGNHQGVVLVLGEYPYRDLEALLAAAPPDRPLVVLDQVQDPHNLGAILRSAWVLGAAGAVIPERRACGVTAAVVRTSAGASEHLPVARVVNLGRALEALKAAGYWLHGAVGEALEGERTSAPEALDLTGRAALLLGSEGSGLRRSVRQACDHLVTIPMEDPLSLNVSVAAGILLAESARQRRARAAAG